MPFSAHTKKARCAEDEFRNEHNSNRLSSKTLENIKTPDLRPKNALVFILIISTFANAQDATRDKDTAGDSPPKEEDATGGIKPGEKETTGGTTGDRETTGGTTGDRETTGGTTGDRETTGGTTENKDTTGDSPPEENDTTGGTTGDRETTGGTTGDREATGGTTEGKDTTGGTTADRETTGGTTEGKDTTDGTTGDRETTGGTTEGKDTTGGTTEGKDATGGATGDRETTGGTTEDRDTTGGTTGDKDATGGIRPTDKDGTGDIKPTDKDGSGMVKPTEELTILPEKPTDFDIIEVKVKLFENIKKFFLRPMVMYRMKLGLEDLTKDDFSMIDIIVERAPDGFDCIDAAGERIFLKAGAKLKHDCVLKPLIKDRCLNPRMTFKLVSKNHPDIVQRCAVSLFYPEVPKPEPQDDVSIPGIDFDDATVAYEPVEIMLKGLGMIEGDQCCPHMVAFITGCSVSAHGDFFVEIPEGEPITGRPEPTDGKMTRPPTEKPEQTGNPEKPLPTDEKPPPRTQEPGEETEKPRMTEKPRPTEKPQETEKPRMTEKPRETEEKAGETTKPPREERPKRKRRSLENMMKRSCESFKERPLAIKAGVKIFYKPGYSNSEFSLKIRHACATGSRINILDRLKNPLQSDKDQSTALKILIAAKQQKPCLNEISTLFGRPIPSKGEDGGFTVKSLFTVPTSKYSGQRSQSGASSPLDLTTENLVDFGGIIVMKALAKKECGKWQYKLQEAGEFMDIDPETFNGKNVLCLTPESILRFVKKAGAKRCPRFLEIKTKDTSDMTEASLQPYEWLKEKVGICRNLLEVQVHEEDCKGVINGQASVDTCDKCELPEKHCKPKCDGEIDSDAEERCGECLGGKSGKSKDASKEFFNLIMKKRECCMDGEIVCGECLPAKKVEEMKKDCNGDFICKTTRPAIEMACADKKVCFGGKTGKKYEDFFDACKRCLAPGTVRTMQICEEKSILSFNPPKILTTVEQKSVKICFTKNLKGKIKKCSLKPKAEGGADCAMKPSEIFLKEASARLIPTPSQCMTILPITPIAPCYDFSAKYHIDNACAVGEYTIECEDDQEEKPMSKLAFVIEEAAAELGEFTISPMVVATGIKTALKIEGDLPQDLMCVYTMGEKSERKAAIFDTAEGLSCPILARIIGDIKVHLETCDGRKTKQVTIKSECTKPPKPIKALELIGYSRLAYVLEFDELFSFHKDDKTCMDFVHMKNKMLGIRRGAEVLTDGQISIPEKCYSCLGADASTSDVVTQIALTLKDLVNEIKAPEEIGTCHDGLRLMSSCIAKEVTWSVEYDGESPADDTDGGKLALLKEKIAQHKGKTLKVLRNVNSWSIHGRKLIFKCVCTDDHGQTAEAIHKLAVNDAVTGARVKASVQKGKLKIVGTSGINTDCFTDKLAFTIRIRDFVDETDETQQQADIIETVFHDKTRVAVNIDQYRGVAEKIKEIIFEEESIGGDEIVKGIAKTLVTIAPIKIEEMGVKGRNVFSCDYKGKAVFKVLAKLNIRDLTRFTYRLKSCIPDEADEECKLDTMVNNEGKFEIMPSEVFSCGQSYKLKFEVLLDNEVLMAKTKKVVASDLDPVMKAVFRGRKLIANIRNVEDIEDVTLHYITEENRPADLDLGKHNHRALFDGFDFEAVKDRIELIKRKKGAIRLVLDLLEDEIFQNELILFKVVAHNKQAEAEEYIPFFEHGKPSGCSLTLTPTEGKAMNTTFEAVLEDCVTGLDSEDENDETEKPRLEYAVTTICNGKMRKPLRWTSDSTVRLGKVCEAASDSPLKVLAFVRNKVGHQMKYEATLDISPSTAAGDELIENAMEDAKRKIEEGDHSGAARDTSDGNTAAIEKKRIANEENEFCEPLDSLAKLRQTESADMIKSLPADTENLQNFISAFAKKVCSDEIIDVEMSDFIREFNEQKFRELAGLETDDDDEDDSDDDDDDEQSSRKRRAVNKKFKEETGNGGGGTNGTGKGKDSEKRKRRAVNKEQKFKEQTNEGDGGSNGAGKEEDSEKRKRRAVNEEETPVEETFFDLDTIESFVNTQEGMTTPPDASNTSIANRKSFMEQLEFYQRSLASHLAFDEDKTFVGEQNQLELHAARISNFTGLEIMTSFGDSITFNEQFADSYNDWQCSETGNCEGLSFAATSVKVDIYHDDYLSYNEQRISNIVHYRFMNPSGDSNPELSDAEYDVIESDLINNHVHVTLEVTAENITGTPVCKMWNSTAWTYDFCSTIEATGVSALHYKCQCWKQGPIGLFDVIEEVDVAPATTTVLPATTTTTTVGNNEETTSSNINGGDATTTDSSGMVVTDDSENGGQPTDELPTTTTSTTTTTTTTTTAQTNIVIGEKEMYKNKIDFKYEANFDDTVAKFGSRDEAENYICIEVKRKIMHKLSDPDQQFQNCRISAGSIQVTFDLYAEQTDEIKNHVGLMVQNNELELVIDDEKVPTVQGYYVVNNNDFEPVPTQAPEEEDDGDTLVIVVVVVVIILIICAVVVVVLFIMKKKASNQKVSPSPAGSYAKMRESPGVRTDAGIDNPTYTGTQ